MPEEPTRPTRPSLAGLAVLIVDDDEATVYAWSRYLSGTGARVMSATDGASALILLRQETVDVLVTDIVMPGVHGFQLLEVAKSLAKPAAAIAVTAYPDGARSALARGFAACLEKPVEPLELAREIARCVRKKRD